MYLPFPHARIRVPLFSPPPKKKLHDEPYDELLRPPGVHTFESLSPG
jgi:hypothetical protein